MGEDKVIAEAREAFKAMAKATPSEKNKIFMSLMTKLKQAKQGGADNG